VLDLPRWADPLCFVPVAPLLSTSPRMSLELVARAERNPAHTTALVAPEGLFRYRELLEASAVAATRLLAGRDDLEGARVGYLVPPGWAYTVVQWAVWRAGGLGVPLATSHPAAELAYVLDDAEPEAVVVHPSLVGRIREVADERRIPVLQTPALLATGARGALPDVAERRPALMLYTSGTTGRPKGVVLRHGNLRAQMESLTEAWGWVPKDHILLHLPLHHVHGIVNVLGCALWNGATCEVLPRFNPVDVWERLARGEVTLYMAVPTVYRRLIDAWREADPDSRNAWAEGARACRLMVSGSAALPVPTLQQWERITRHRLLERYGMTEIGMALSNPLHGERRPGFVGTPLPGVAVRLVDDEAEPVAQGSPGEIQVRGPTVFSEYWRRPTETAEAFTEDGWFRTGDQAVVEQGYYRILGRSSVDILKTGGEKISALEIEDVLRSHPGVADCAVVGLPDADWGERVCAAIVPRPGDVSTPEELRAFAKSRLAPYKVPKDVLLVPDLPRNAMGKVTKPDVRSLFTPDDDDA
jgi:malonyl-CoA/methylmalonyl-CoA synthetase